MAADSLLEIAAPATGTDEGARRLNLANPSPTCAITPLQSSRAVCRKISMEGYHGVSLRSRSQRQSDAVGSNSQTGFPRAPARCATDVSTLTTKSSSAIAAAVSLKSSNCGPRSVSGTVPSALLALQVGLFATNRARRRVFARATEVLQLNRGETVAPVRRTSCPKQYQRADCRPGKQGAPSISRRALHPPICTGYWAGTLSGLIPRTLGRLSDGGRRRDGVGTP